MNKKFSDVSMILNESNSAEEQFRSDQAAKKGGKIGKYAGIAGAVSSLPAIYGGLGSAASSLPMAYAAPVLAAGTVGSVIPLVAGGYVGYKVGKMAGRRIRKMYKKHHDKKIQTENVAGPGSGYRAAWDEDKQAYTWKKKERSIGQTARLGAAIGFGGGLAAKKVVPWEKLKMKPIGALRGAGIGMGAGLAYAAAKKLSKPANE